MKRKKMTAKERKDFAKFSRCLRKSGKEFIDSLRWPDFNPYDLSDNNHPAARRLK